MYAILIIVSITLHGHQHTAYFASQSQYASSECDKRADAMAERISSRIAKAIRPHASVKFACEKRATRSI